MSTVEPTRAIVPIKSAWSSKIVWTQVIAIAAMAGTLFGVEIPHDLQLQIVAGIVAVQGVITMLLKTFFTNTVTPNSVPPGTGMRE